MARNGDGQHNNKNETTTEQMLAQRTHQEYSKDAKERELQQKRKFPYRAASRQTPGLVLSGYSVFLTFGHLLSCFRAGKLVIDGRSASVNVTSSVLLGVVL